MTFDLLNVTNDLTDPDNTPSGYGSLDLNNGGWIIIGILIFIIVVLMFAILYLYLKADKYKTKENAENVRLNNAELSEEERQIITEFRKLTDQEKQILNDTIKTFNNAKKE